MFGPMPNPALSGDSMSLSRAVLRERLGQQIAVADFGRIALVESDLQVVLDAAVSCCARSLGAEFAKVLRYVPERKVLVQSEEHTSELQSLMRISYAVFCL